MEEEVDNLCRKERRREGRRGRERERWETEVTEEIKIENEKLGRERLPFFLSFLRINVIKCS